MSPAFFLWMAAVGAAAAPSSLPLPALLGTSSGTVLNTGASCRVLRGDPPRLSCRMAEISPVLDAHFLLDDALHVMNIDLALAPGADATAARAALRPLLAHLTAARGPPRAQRRGAISEWVWARPAFACALRMRRVGAGWELVATMHDPTYRPVVVPRPGAGAGAQAASAGR